MSKIGNFLLESTLVGALFILMPVLRAEAGTNIDWNELKQGSGPVVLLVNGFGGCDPCITGTLHDKLKGSNITVYDLDWNDIYRRTQQDNFNLADAEFLKQMDSVIASIPESRPIILIGHSFGGDSILKVAQRTSRKIDLLAVLDAVELGGVRTRRSVGENVSYFYNRWTTNPTGFRIPGLSVGAAIPLNSGDSGALSCSASSCDQKDQSLAYNADGSEIRDDCESWEVTCPGYNPIPVALGGSNGTKHRRITHGRDNAIYKDEYIQEQLFKKILQVSNTIVLPPIPPRSDKFRVRNRWNPNCLASIGNSQSIDNRIGMGTCDSSNSIWRWDGQQIKNGWNPYCLGSIGNSQAIDNPVVMGACGQSNAVWRWDRLQIKNGWNPYCLGSIGNSKAVDNPVVMGACGQSNAVWYIEPIQ